MRQMLFTEVLLLNPSVTARDEKRLSKQALRVWELFQNGENSYKPVWTRQLAGAAYQYGARISEVRSWLRNYGLTLDITCTDGRGNNRYEVKEFDGSNYQKLLRKKGLA